MPPIETSSEPTASQPPPGATTATDNPSGAGTAGKGGASAPNGAANGAGKGQGQERQTQGGKDPEVLNRIRRDGYLKAIGKAPAGTSNQAKDGSTTGRTGDGEQPGGQNGHGKEGGKPSGEGSPSSSFDGDDERSKLAQRNEKIVEAKAFIRRFTKGKFDPGNLDSMTQAAVLQLAETLKERHADFGRELNARGKTPSDEQPPEDDDEAASHSDSPPSTGKGRKAGAGDRQPPPGGKADKSAPAIPAGLEDALRLMDPEEADRTRSELFELFKRVQDADTREKQYREKEASFHFATGLNALEADFPMLGDEAGVQRLAEYLMAKPERKEILLSGDVKEIHETMRDAAKIVFYDQVREKAKSKATDDFRRQTGNGLGGDGSASRPAGQMGSKPTPEQIRKAGFRAAKEGRTPDENRTLMQAYLSGS
jgi:hypothetical protein